MGDTPSKFALQPICSLLGCSFLKLQQFILDLLLQGWIAVFATGYVVELGVSQAVLLNNLRGITHKTVADVTNWARNILLTADIPRDITAHDPLGIGIISLPPLFNFKGSTGIVPNLWIRCLSIGSGMKAQLQ